MKINMTKNKKTLPVNSIIRLAAIMVLLAVLFFYITTGSFIYILKEREYENIESKIAIAFKSESRQDLMSLESILSLHNVYENLVTQKSKEWIDKNINNGVFSTYRNDYWIGFENDTFNLITKSKGVKLSTKELSNLKIRKKPLSESSKMEIKYSQINNEIYKITSVPFSTDRDQKWDKKKLLMGVKIDDNYLLRLSSNYHLPEIKFNKEWSNNIFIGSGTKSDLFWNHHSKLNSSMSYMAIIGLFLLFLFAFLIKVILVIELKANDKYKKMLYSASTDSLTKIANRRFFLNFTRKEFKKLSLENEVATLLLVDIDYFKLINDQYGHETGDKALQHFVKVIKSVLRSKDLLGRIGGDEFAIFLPETTKEMAMHISERIHDALKEMPFLLPNKKNHSMTASIGAITNEDKKLPLKGLMILADKALYISKEKGRNQTNFYKK